MASVITKTDTAHFFADKRMWFVPVDLWLTRVFIFFICFTAYIPLAINIAGLNLRTSQLLLPVIFTWLWVRGHVWKIKVSSLLLLFLGGMLWLTFLFWTLVNFGANSNPIGSLGRVFLLGLNLLHVIAVYLLVVRTRRLEDAVYSFVASVTLFNGFLLIITVLANQGIEIFQNMLVEQAAPVLVDGQFTTATVARFSFGGITSGVLSAATLIIVTTMLFQPGKRQRHWFIWIFVGISVIGLVLGFSRQGVISLVAGLMVVSILFMMRGYLRVFLRFVILLPFLIVPSLWIISVLPGATPFYQAFAGRALQLFQPDAYTTGTVSARTLMWNDMWIDIVRNPWIGAGQDAYLRYMVNPDEQGSHNFPLEILHTSGLFGFFAYLSMHTIILFLAFHTVLRRGGHTETAKTYRWLLISLIGATIAVWVSSLTNLIFSNPSYWACSGLLLAGIHVTRHQTHPYPLVGTPHQRNPPLTIDPGGIS